MELSFFGGLITLIKESSKKSYFYKTFVRTSEIRL